MSDNKLKQNDGERNGKTKSKLTHKKKSEPYHKTESIYDHKSKNGGKTKNEPKYNIIHLDVNETICKFDSTKKSTNDEINGKKRMAALTTIAKYMKGKVINDKFIKDDEGNLTYKEFLSSKHEKEVREEITQKILEQFPDTKTKLMYNNLVTNMGNSILLPSAIELFNKLLKEDNKFIVLFRTFGTDFHLVKTSLEKLYPGIEIIEKNPKKVSEYFDILKEIMIKGQSAFIYIKDDFFEWKNKGQKSEFSKVFPLIPLNLLENHEIQNWFFDDNENIINPRTENNLFYPESNLPSNCHTILVDTYKNVINKNYFIEIIFQST